MEQQCIQKNTKLKQAAPKSQIQLMTSLIMEDTGRFNSDRSEYTPPFPSLHPK